MRETKKRLRLGELVEDFDLYPRQQVDGTHLAAMREAYEAGAVLPAIVIDAVSRRITDGFHRRRVLRAAHGDEHVVQVIAREYPNEGAMFLDAVRMNAKHGRNLSPFERRRCIQKCKRFRLRAKAMAQALGMRPETFRAMGEGRTAQVIDRGQSKPTAVILKRTVEHMSGQTLTHQQREANDRLGGMRQTYYVNQVLLLVESDLLDRSDDGLMEAIGKLHGALSGLLCVD